MGKAQPKPVSCSERLLWWLFVIGGLLVVLAAVPAVPWRLSRTDTNMGNRFVVDRWYNLFGATNQFGKTVNWFTLKKKMRQKSEEFGRPSPTSALVGTVGNELGAGGAVMGCAVWQACKDHVAARYANYATLAACGMFSLFSLVIGALCCVGTLIFMNFENSVSSKKDKKKKKKKEPEYEECLTPQGRTMVCSICAFALSFIGVASFMYVLDSSLKDFKTTAYYPYAKSHAAAYVGGFGCWLLFICMVMCINRVASCCGKRDSEENEQMAGPPGPGGKGGYAPQTYGGYGGYGEHAGGYPPQYQQWQPPAYAPPQQW